MMSMETTAESLDESFLQSLLTEDEVGRVIRSHLHLEAQIIRYLELSVVRPEYLDKLNLTYARKIDLICCLGFDENFRSALKKLGSIRNKFAHDLSYRLSKEVIKDLYNSLPEFGKKAVVRSVGILITKLGLEEIEPKFENVPIDLQFVIIMLNLERVCYAACDLIEQASNRSS